MYMCLVLTKGLELGLQRPIRINKLSQDFRKPSNSNVRGIKRNWKLMTHTSMVQFPLCQLGFTSNSDTELCSLLLCEAR